MAISKRARTLGAGVLALITAATISGSTAAAEETAPARPDKPTEPSLVGAVKTYRADGEAVRFRFDAHGLGETARGTFHVSHYSADHTEGGEFSGTIDCLIVGGPVAIATGMVTKSDQYPGLVGVRRGFSVYDGGRKDRIGYSWVFDPGSLESVPKCLSAAPFEWVEEGNFTTVEWLPIEGPKHK
ncbi:hypothetical protein EV193_109268 [Herbihabitans rhizosphaerae]|uniref:Repetin n=1 Tax=Herbihabitans rhizosphaerae TaxID=1872711 RepID=A0A4V2ERY4_9PSEU|nr:hypothetical protein [Herbihabitans rhizosphaerae]RZS34477.1 hypothetical protein EV193_109268 [Herbihabitans rhizosphaerae]